ncbi:hypothetical protein P154DRAFT_448706, partial [Amniculicola lignicola CBS 123094]
IPQTRKLPMSSLPLVPSARQPPTECQYHYTILNLQERDQKERKHMDPMERFLSEGPGEQSALYVRSDTEELSISRECFCRLLRETLLMVDN